MVHDVCIVRPVHVQQASYLSDHNDVEKHLLMGLAASIKTGAYHQHLLVRWEPPALGCSELHAPAVSLAAASAVFAGQQRTPLHCADVQQMSQTPHLTAATVQA